MRPLYPKNCDVKYLVFVIDLFNKYICVKPLKD